MPAPLHDLMTSAGRITTTSSITPGPLRRFRHFHQGVNLSLGPHRLLAAKSTSFTAMATALESVTGVLHEVSTTHKAFCARWGITERELEDTPESTATTAYGAYIMDIGFQGDTIKLNMALAACLLGYGEVGLWLVAESKRLGSWVVMDESSNPYVPWIREYSGEMYQRAVDTGLGTPPVCLFRLPLSVDGVTVTIESISLKTSISGANFEEWVEIWKKCVLLEKGFWDMAISLS